MSVVDFFINLPAAAKLLNIDLYEWIGYLASVLVLISLLMSSIIKLRWINLVGSLVFSVYGFLIGAFPVGFMNLGIVIINIYYLVRIYGAKELFQIMPVEKGSTYLKYFLEFYDPEIRLFFDEYDNAVQSGSFGFFILRNMVPAGLFIARRTDEQTLEVGLDFVTPEYRDFKVGKYLFKERRDYFLKLGVSRLTATSTNVKHSSYLVRMGFQPDSRTTAPDLPDGTVRYSLNL
ncbi:MAG: GNAT family N-acetyltransferase [Saccharofermentanales bacterium]